MLAPLQSVRTLLIAIFMLMAGSGFLSTLIAVRLEIAGANAFTIGMVGTAYFGGLMVGSFRVPALIGRIGHIRAFAAFVTIFSASSLAYALAMDPLAWTALRFVDGIAMAGVFVCLESWLNRQAAPQSRSTILAAYMVFLYGGQAAGQFLLNLGEDRPDLPFMFSAILLSLALLPVVLTRMEQPRVETIAAFSLRRLYDASPLGVVGVVLTGAILGAFYGLGAVYVQRIGLGLSQVALFTSCVIAGGVALQTPLGMLSDRFDRRKVIVGCLLAVVLISAAIAFLPLARLALFACGGLFGGFAFALYPLCVAHSNDHLGEDERLEASSGLVLAYSAGAVAGPLLASLSLSSLGAPGLFVLTGGLALTGAMFGLARMVVAAPVSADDQQSFRGLPRTTPMVAVLETEAERGSNTEH
ncbi:MFS transporter [Qipengyuania sp. XHP0207]|uniref:MFS transporter n=1 Tax=Qipengyuania sp. XHP0207 TaxID=3038078 RepID=UPI00241E0CA8|nr:MFS transporter [Qipengyuania sp. XHP0207]MDG5747606.1 MFS transporter [Qipengyuania sp. XHP0207]